ncbi:MAG: 2-phosphosulfolactate phosphatase [Planctomycetaceae bacterium]
MNPEAKRITIHLLPPADGLPADSHLAVIVDVLRASTTIASSLVAGAKAVVPCLTVEDARSVATKHGALLGGERGGIKLDGFDFGNSPTEYTADAVAGKIIAFTTTNGTRALMQSRNAAEIVIGAFVNLTAVAEKCLATDADLHIVCAGTDGVISAEDVLFAGLLAYRLCCSGRFQPANDATQIAMDFSVANAENPPRLLEAIRRSQGGRNLIKLGCDSDIEFAANIDRFDTVPSYDADAGEIR